jgi:kynureninase
MQKGFVPDASAQGWQLSTPSPILYAAAKASLDIFEQASMEAIAQKGQLLSDYLLFILADINSKLEQPFIQLITPPQAKGCQVSMLMLRNGKEIFNELAANGVFADWREPDVIRVAPVPLYNTFEEVWQFGKILEQACKKVAATVA